MRHLDLFSGIGGFALAVDTVWPGAEHIFCDNDPFCQAVLRKNFPNSVIMGDIKELTPERLWKEFARAAEGKQTLFHQTQIVGGKADTAENARANTTESGVQKTGNTIMRESRNGRRKGDSPSSLPMGTDASVVGKPSRSSSPLTIRTTMDSRKEKINDSKDRHFTPDLLSKDFQKGDTKSYVTTATTQKGSTENAHTTKIDLLTGGFPCQPFSHAGKRKGTDDDRHLWPEMRRVIQEFLPRFVVAENVRGLLSIDGGMVFEQACLDLEALGYEVQPFVIPACAVNAPHERKRVWIVAHAKSKQAHATKQGGFHSESCLSDKDAPDAAGIHVRRRRGEAQRYHREPQREGAAQGRGQWDENWPQAATRLCSLDDGLPGGLVRPRGWRNAALKAAGNAIVPAVAVEIFKAIKYVQ